MWKAYHTLVCVHLPDMESTSEAFFKLKGPHLNKWAHGCLLWLAQAAAPAEKNTCQVSDAEFWTNWSPHIGSKRSVVGSISARTIEGNEELLRYF